MKLKLLFLSRRNNKIKENCTSSLNEVFVVYMNTFNVLNVSMSLSGETMCGTMTTTTAIANK